MKPISTVPRALRSVDMETGSAATAIHQRSDVCAVPAAGVVAEAMVALVLAQAVLEKFGGDSVVETRRNFLAYQRRVEQKLAFSEDATAGAREMYWDMEKVHARLSCLVGLPVRVRQRLVVD